MWSVLKTSMVLTAVFLLAGTDSASAAMFEVNVPFSFLVCGHTLPAGAYRIENDEMDSSVLLIRGEKSNHVAQFVLAMPAAGHDPGGQLPTLTFTKGETQYQLNDIWESGNQGFQVESATHHKN